MEFFPTLFGVVVVIVILLESVVRVVDGNFLGAFGHCLGPMDEKD